MSLSKRFPLFDLPLLPLEQVILPLDPKDLLFFALSSENARQLLRVFPLVKYFDINVWDTSVIFSICFKSGEPIKWEFKMKLPFNASVESRRWANIELLDGTKRTARLFKVDGMRMVLWKTEFEDPVEMRCSLPKEHFVDYIRRIGYLFQSICPGQRIRNLRAGKVGWEDEKVFFHMDRITRCDNFRFFMYDGDNLLEILERMDVKRKITLMCKQKKKSNLEWINNEKIRNIPELELSIVNGLSLSQFLSFENEHLHIKKGFLKKEECLLKPFLKKWIKKMKKKIETYLNEYLKKWMNGEFTKRRTLTVFNYQWHGLDDTVLNGLTPEPVETWEKLGKPGYVQFSNELYLNPIPQTVPGKYQTALLKNCRGQFATVVQTNQEFYFIRWDHPLPPINIPGNELWEYSDSPLARVFPRNF